MPEKELSTCVKFHFLHVNAELKNRTALKIFLCSLFKKEHTSLSSLIYIFCTDEYLLEINKSFLNHNYYTDVISFNLGNKKEPVEGEIYISLERVRDNAQKLGQPFKIEILRVIFHGALHLCGYKDNTITKIKMMRKMEERYLDLYLKKA